MKARDLLRALPKRSLHTAPPKRSQNACLHRVPHCASMHFTSKMMHSMRKWAAKTVPMMDSAGERLPMLNMTATTALANARQAYSVSWASASATLGHKTAMRKWGAKTVPMMNSFCKTGPMMHTTATSAALADQRQIHSLYGASPAASLPHRIQSAAAFLPVFFYL